MLSSILRFYTPGIVLGALLLTSASSFAREAACESFCFRGMEVAQEKCLKESSKDICEAAIPQAIQKCLAECDVEVVIPSRTGVRGVAMRKATSLWGHDVTLFDVQNYLGSDGSPSTYLFVFARGRALDKDAVIARLSGGADAGEFDAHFGCIESGANIEMPPILAHWEGLPLEYLAEAQTQNDLNGRYGKRSYSLARRHRSAVFPIFEYDATGDSFFVDPRSQRTTREMRVTRNEEIRGSQRFAERRESIKRLWKRELGGLGN